MSMPSETKRFGKHLITCACVREGPDGYWIGNPALCDCITTPSPSERAERAIESSTYEGKRSGRRVMIDTLAERITSEITAAEQAALHRGVDAAKEAIRSETGDTEEFVFWRASFINAIARKCGFDRADAEPPSKETV